MKTTTTTSNVKWREVLWRRLCGVVGRMHSGSRSSLPETQLKMGSILAAFQLTNTKLREKENQQTQHQRRQRRARKKKADVVAVLLLLKFLYFRVFFSLRLPIFLIDFSEIFAISKAMSKMEADFDFNFDVSFCFHPFLLPASLLPKTYGPVYHFFSSRIIPKLRAAFHHSIK